MENPARLIAENVYPTIFVSRGYEISICRLCTPVSRISVAICENGNLTISKHIPKLAFVSNCRNLVPFCNVFQIFILPSYVVDANRFPVGDRAIAQPLLDPPSSVIPGFFLLV